MMSRPNFRAAFLSAMACALAIVCGATAPRLEAGPNVVQDKASQDKASQDTDNDLVIEPKELPKTYPHGQYQVNFRLRGKFVMAPYWKVEKGTLPPGIKLEENGVLHGEAERAGEYHFTLSGRDKAGSEQAVQRDFTISVVEAMMVAWKVPAHVTGNRIDGSVEISNTTPEDIDLTFEVKAVNEYGRATEIGYQHFPLKKGTTEMALPFGETLPHGTYMVYVDVNGEITRRNLIYKEQMKTPAALQVLVGP